MDAEIRVLVTGAAGRMGREVVRAVCAADGMSLVGAVDLANAGQDAGAVAGIGPAGIPIRSDLEGALRDAAPNVMVDFTIARAAQANVMTAIDRGVRFVVGTSGMQPEAVEAILHKAAVHGVAGAIVPNFALGAVLMMRFARVAAQYLPACEIVELHHDGKVDFPSGTAKATAHEVASGRGDAVGHARGLGGRGTEIEGVPIHSVRLPGLVAHQEVIFGGAGETLTIRHDSLGRDSFMPGVLLAIRRVVGLDRVVTGLDPLLD
ncbi:MAG TPA: 4-hydroxy-tetrahydrodipicolinate reductase [Firmicutes bacterium]|jgi:4-hydroxy-tetrahydrodipicolinate reductase|nr:4-hydroxy-tetrahydrodipicolinate reductase [Bacillota bacterium]HBK59668.1 4-hydroxy-tetrahydrodipicolinate reductase [Bacillota bacterium]